MLYWGLWNAKSPLLGAFCLLLTGFYGIRDTGVATPRRSPRHRDGPYWIKELFDIPVSVRKSSSGQYLSKEVLKESPSIEAADFGSPDWKLTLCLMLAWLIIFLCLIKGIKSSGKVLAELHRPSVLHCHWSRCDGLDLNHSVAMPAASSTHGFNAQKG